MGRGGPATPGARGPRLPSPPERRLRARPPAGSSGARWGHRGEVSAPWQGPSLERGETGVGTASGGRSGWRGAGRPLQLRGMWYPGRGSAGGRGRVCSPSGAREDRQRRRQTRPPSHSHPGFLGRLLATVSSLALSKFGSSVCSPPSLPPGGRLVSIQA